MEWIEILPQSLLWRRILLLVVSSWLFEGLIRPVCEVMIAMSTVSVYLWMVTLLFSFLSLRVPSNWPETAASRPWIQLLLKLLSLIVSLIAFFWDSTLAGLLFFLPNSLTGFTGRDIRKYVYEVTIFTIIEASIAAQLRSHELKVATGRKELCALRLRLNHLKGLQGEQAPFRFNTRVDYMGSWLVVEASIVCDGESCKVTNAIVVAQSEN